MGGWLLSHLSPPQFLVYDVISPISRHRATQAKKKLSKRPDTHDTTTCCNTKARLSLSNSGGMGEGWEWASSPRTSGGSNSKKKNCSKNIIIIIII